MFYHCIDADIKLRLLESTDAKALFEIINSERTRLREWLGWVDYTKSPSDVERFIEAKLSNFVNGQGLEFGIWNNGELSGVLGATIDSANKVAELGYWLSIRAVGNGVMTRSCQAVIDMLFEERNINRIEIRAAQENIRSRAVPERLLFADEGILRQSEWLYDHFVDLVLYTRLSNDR